MRVHIGWAVGLTAWRIDLDGGIHVRTWIYCNGSTEDDEDAVLKAAVDAFKERLEDDDWNIQYSHMPITKNISSES